MVAEDAYKSFDGRSVRDHELTLSLWDAYISGRRLSETLGWSGLIAGILALLTALSLTGMIHADITGHDTAVFILAVILLLGIVLGLYLPRVRKDLRERMKNKAHVDRGDNADILCVPEKQWESFRKRHML